MRTSSASELSAASLSAAGPPQSSASAARATLVGVRCIASEDCEVMEEERDAGEDDESKTGNRLSLSILYCMVRVFCEVAIFCTSSFLSSTRLDGCLVSEMKQHESDHEVAHVQYEQGSWQLQIGFTF